MSAVEDMNIVADEASDLVNTFKSKGFLQQEAVQLTCAIFAGGGISITRVIVTQADDLTPPAGMAH